MIVKLLSRLFSLCLLVTLLWGAGFAFFAYTITSYKEPAIDDKLEPTMAVVVLTGGSERLMAGFEILKAGKAKKLFISGVYPGVKPSTLLANVNMPKELEQCCIELGHQAGNTIGNADETAAYMRRQNLNSMRLVTANYHMPRSMLLLQRRMPDITIIPHPVDPDNAGVSSWWRHGKTASLMVMEYCKYLYALAGGGFV